MMYKTLHRKLEIVQHVPRRVMTLAGLILVVKFTTQNRKSLVDSYPTGVTEVYN
jgi:hypothetical protein